MGDKLILYMTQKTQFSDFNLDPKILKALENKNFTNPTPIQMATLDIALNSNMNIFGKAQTGTGKTAAFSLPILNSCDEKKKHIQALVLCPTRELAGQVEKEIRELKGEKNLFASSIYGGQSYEKQLKSLKMGDQIIIGTPGRIVDHLKKGTLDLSNLRYFVLDEADEMLKMGFMDELDFILEHVPNNVKKYFYSATFPKNMQRLVSSHLGDYELIEIKSENKVNKLSKQTFIEIKEHQKIDALKFILNQEEDFYGIIFCNTKMIVDKLNLTLKKIGYKADCIHGDIAQGQRERVLRNFKEKKINILVATDVAARGIDVDNLTHVINYHLPENAESFIHRVGRTGRAGNKGTAITFVSCEEYRQFKSIEKINQVDFHHIQLPTPKEMEGLTIEKIRNEVEKISGKDPLYSKIKEVLLKNFDHEEILLKLIQKAYGGEKTTQFEEINKSKKSREFGRRSRGRGGRRERERGRDRNRGRFNSGKKGGSRRKFKK